MRRIFMIVIMLAPLLAAGCAPDQAYVRQIESHAEPILSDYVRLLNAAEARGDLETESAAIRRDSVQKFRLLIRSGRRDAP